MNKTAIAVLTSMTLILGVAPALAFNSYGGSFSDDDGNVHEANIEALKDSKITFGCDDTEFCPADSVTRGQMAAFIVRAFKLPRSSTDYFGDDNGTLFERDINALRESRITSGCNPPNNDAYCPDAPVTRGQMAVFITKALGRSTTDRYENYFTDDNGSIFEARIDELRNAGVTSGCNPPANNKYCPNNPVTRAEMATFLSRALGLKASDPTPFGNSTCDPAYFPCVPTVEEFGDFNCHLLRKPYPDGVQRDPAFGDPSDLDADRDETACEDFESPFSFGGTTNEWRCGAVSSLQSMSCLGYTDDVDDDPGRKRLEFWSCDIRNSFGDEELSCNGFINGIDFSREEWTCTFGGTAPSDDVQCAGDVDRRDAADETWACNEGGQFNTYDIRCVGNINKGTVSDEVWSCNFRDFGIVECGGDVDDARSGTENWACYVDRSYDLSCNGNPGFLAPALMSWLIVR